MCSARDGVGLSTPGFPIRASAGHWPFSASPRLIAAVHALHRLLVPRHPPCALTILTVILFGKSLAALPGDTRVIGYCAVFKVRKEADPSRGGPRHVLTSHPWRTGLSKLNSTRSIAQGRLTQEKSARTQSGVPAAGQISPHVRRDELAPKGVGPGEIARRQRLRHCRSLRFLPSVIRTRELRQVRSTFLAAGCARGERHGALASSGGDPPATGALVKKGSLERR